MSSPLPQRGQSAALAKDRLGIPAVMFFILSAIAPMTVAAGVVTTLYAVTGLSAIGAAFLAVAVVLAVFAVGYVAMARHITNAGALYAFVSRGLGRPFGVGAPWSQRWPTTRSRSASTACSGPRCRATWPTSSVWTSRGGCGRWAPG
jgi:hypothetical protein